MRQRRSVVGQLAFVLPLLAVVLLWRSGRLPAWVYHGRLHDEVQRRTGFDLADRGALDAPKVNVVSVHGEPGSVPVVVAEFENAGTRPVKALQAVAAFRAGAPSKLPISTTRQRSSEGPRSLVVDVAGRSQPPLNPGERRVIRLPSRSAFDPRTLLRKPAPITADLYVGGAFRSDGYPAVRQRNGQSDGAIDNFLRAETNLPEVEDIVVRP